MTRSALLLTLLLAALPAAATTYTVMQDGTGDYTDIQSAVDQCAVGDTVLVGPGRYEGYQPFIPGEEDIGWETIVGIAVDSLTIRGVDNETVVIGPETKDDERLVRIGVATALATTWVVLENLRFENIGGRGAHLYPSGRVSGCVFSEIGVGLTFERGIAAIVEDCTFFNTEVYVVSQHIEGSIAVVRNCSFQNWGGGVYAKGHMDVLVEQCQFEGTGVAVQGTGDSHLTVKDCTMVGGNSAIGGTNLGNGSIDIQSCHATGQLYQSGVSPEIRDRIPQLLNRQLCREMSIWKWWSSRKIARVLRGIWGISGGPPWPKIAD